MTGGVAFRNAVGPPRRAAEQQQQQQQQHVSPTFFGETPSFGTPRERVLSHSVDCTLHPVFFFKNTNYWLSAAPQPFCALANY